MWECKATLESLDKPPTGRLPVMKPLFTFHGQKAEGYRSFSFHFSFSFLYFMPSPSIAQ
jgi:hypothetical protein